MYSFYFIPTYSFPSLTQVLARHFLPFVNSEQILFLMTYTYFNGQLFDIVNL